MSVKMLLIFNPVAGKGEFTQNLFEVIDRFTRKGFEVTVYPTAKARDAFDITFERAKDFNCIVCSGGDGTLNEVVDALMLMKERPRLGYIPSGTTNDFAYTHGLETDPLIGVNSILQGDVTAIDVGRLGDEYFTYVAAFGLFTDVTYGTPQGMKNLFGYAAYLMEGVKKLGSIRNIHCVVECDDERIEGDFALGMILNSKSVGGFRLPAGITVQLDDGKFELVLLRRVHNLAEMQEVASVLMGVGTPSSSFIVRSASRIRITCEEPVDWSVDGEFGGSHQQVDIEVCHRAIEIITPHKEEAGQKLTESSDR